MKGIKIFLILVILSLGVVSSSFGKETIQTERYQTYIVEGTDVISKNIETIKFPHIGTLSGIVRFFTGDNCLADIEMLAKLNGLNFSQEKYSQNDKSLWLFQGDEVKIPESFFVSNEPVIKDGEKEIAKKAKDEYQIYRIKSVNSISRMSEEIIRSSSIGTLSGVTKYFTGRIKITDLENLAQLNGLAFDEEKYRRNDRSLWLFQGDEVKIPESFFVSNQSAEARSSADLTKKSVKSNVKKVASQKIEKKEGAEALVEKKKDYRKRTKKQVLFYLLLLL